MLRHYADLLRAHVWSILACALGAGLLALALSFALLKANPLYVANVSLTMQPTDEELQFNRTFMGPSQFNPATVIAQSHIERLLSRPVAERALDMMIEARGGTLGAAVEPTLFGKIKTAFWRTWNNLNYGYYSPPSERDLLILSIQESLSVEVVEGSYILYVEVTYTDPAIAAEVANVIAQAYTEEAREAFRREAEEVARAVGESEAQTLARLAELRARRDALARKHGVNDVATERLVALEARQDARLALQDAEIDLRGEETRLANLRTAAVGQTNVDLLREIRESLTLGPAGMDRLVDTVEQRRQSLATIEASLASLQVAEEEFAAVDTDIAASEADLAQLQERRVALDLAARARLSQVMVINPAVVPVYPFFPKVLINTVVGAVVGGLLALTPIFVTDVLGRHVRTWFDLQQLVGVRALPSLSGWRLRAGARRGRAGRAFAETLFRRLAADPAGWPAGPVLVTGYAGARDIARLAALIEKGAAVAGLGREGAPVAVSVLPPVPRLADWSGIGAGALVVLVPSGEVERDEVAALALRAERQGARAWFTVRL